MKMPKLCIQYLVPVQQGIIALIYVLIQMEQADASAFLDLYFPPTKQHAQVCFKAIMKCYCC